MTDANLHSTVFSNDFDKLIPLIEGEWPEVDAVALEGTSGDYERVVSLITTKTEHSRTLVRKQLGELAAMTDGETAREEVKRLREMANKLQAKSQELADYVRKQMVTDAKEKVSQNPLVALLMAVGLGFIFGFLLKGTGRDR